MKTGRVRKKTPPPPEDQAAPVQPSFSPPSAPPPAGEPRPGTTGGRPKTPVPMGCIAGLVVGVFIVILVLVLVLGGRGGAEEWVKATRADGSWTTSVNVFGPQVAVEERWEADCIDDPLGTVRAGTCVLRDTQSYEDEVVDEYEEFAYDIYYEETWNRIYQAQGTEFAVTTLGTDEWREDDLHYALEEELDRDSCIYSSYTLWVDDPDDMSQEMEVYLSECEVWDHVMVSRRVYEQQPWCQCDVTTLVPLGELDEQGAGARVLWPSADVPAGGRTEQAFRGQVTFLGDDYRYTVTTSDPAEYERYLAGDYYIGVRDGKPVAISANPPD